MSSSEETNTASACESEETKEVRRVFSALPIEQRLTTLFQVQFDLVADVVEGAAAAVSKVLDDVAQSFSSSVSDSPGASASEPQSTTNP
jgi:hypothetical protein